MKEMTDEFQQYLQTLPVSKEQKSKLFQYSQKFHKEAHRLGFQVQRTLKDKSIVVNLLNRTINELQDRQIEVEKANIALQAQKQLVEAQSLKLSEQLQMLEKSYAELEQFSYIASHDLKSPLRTIASYAGLLKRRYSAQLDADAMEFIEYIVKGSSHMNEIIRDLLEYSGIGKEQDLELTDTHEIIELVKQNLSTEITESLATVECEAMPKMYAHKTGLLQLFQNLVANAIKFRGEALPKIVIQPQERKKFWQFTVSDNGLGLDESYQEKAFMPFQRINHLDRPGTGMGLAICKKIVKLHKGDIWYKSEFGKGTTFYFTISKGG